jgi:hypothetical protein
MSKAVDRSVFDLRVGTSIAPRLACLVGLLVSSAGCPSSDTAPAPSSPAPSGSSAGSASLGAIAGRASPAAGSGILGGGSAGTTAGRAVPVAGIGGSVAPAAGSGGGNGLAGAAAAGSSGAGSVAGASANAGAGGAGPSDIEQCYDLRAHGQPTPGDTTRYDAPTGETYTSFTFNAPWQKPVQGLVFRHLADNAAILHHWLLYKENDTSKLDSSISPCQLAGPEGAFCGQATTRELITGWAPGRGDFTLPDGVGLELPPPGGLLAIEFHYYNNTGAPSADQSGVEICTTSKFRTNTASVSWLGSESISVPAGAAGTATGTCHPLRAGMQAADPIHVLFSWPHMHKLGVHMKSVVTRAAGGTDMMYDGDFSFDYQKLYDTPLLLQAGDSVTTTCSYQNTTTATVMFGQSTTQEMCFNFTYAWPAHGLDNPGGALGGASNTCLQ